MTLSALARQDLLDARRYIEDELQNAAAARRVLARLFNSMRTLERFPYAGTPLNVAGVDTEYRALTSGSYRVFYLCDADTVYVVRVLYGRRDFMRALFGVTGEPE